MEILSQMWSQKRGEKGMETETLGKRVEEIWCDSCVKNHLQGIVPPIDSVTCRCQCHPAHYYFIERIGEGVKGDGD